MSFKVIITGASGLLGREIYKTLSKNSQLTVLGLCNTRGSDQYTVCDLTDPSSVQQCFRTFQPNLIIHCAAERRPDVIEKQPELAEKINIKATETLAQLAQEMSACLLFISTDYVMDGKSPPYLEDSTPNPLNVYGLSKLEGEKIVLASNPDNIVVRVPLLYGFVEFLAESAVTILFTKVLDASKPCNMSHYERRYPTHCEDVALYISDIIEKKYLSPSGDYAADIKGVFHFSGHEEMTKYDMSVMMANVFQLNKDHLLPDTNASGGANRPYNAKLSSNKNEKLGLNAKSRKFQDGIRECLKTWLP